MPADLHFTPNATFSGLRGVPLIALSRNSLYPTLTIVLVYVGVSVQRVTKFVKYLTRRGWRPVVHTVSNPYAPVKDQGLERDVPPDLPTISPWMAARWRVSSGKALPISRSSTATNL